MSEKRTDRVQAELAARTDRALDRGIKPGGRTQMNVAMRAAVVKSKMKNALVENNGNVSAAAAAVGVSAGYARKIMPDVRQELMTELEQVDVTSSKLAVVVKDAMEATKSAAFEGAVKESDVPDHVVRMNAARFVTKITGATAPQTNLHLHKHRQVPEEAMPTRIQERLIVLNEYAPQLEAMESAE